MAVCKPRTEAWSSSFCTPSEGPNPALTLSSDFWPPDLWEVNVCCWSPPSLWDSVTAALAHSHRAFRNVVWILIVQKPINFRNPQGCLSSLLFSDKTWRLCSHKEKAISRPSILEGVLKTGSVCVCVCVCVCAPVCNIFSDTRGAEHFKP